MKLKHWLPLAAAALALIGGFFLPNAVVGVMDGRRLGSLIYIDAQSIVFEADPELDLPERLALAASPNTEVLALATGQTMEREAAEARAVRELARFFQSGQYEFADDECTIEAGAAGFVIDSEDPSANMIIWEFKVNDRNSNEVTVVIDDETGTILRLIYQQGNSSLQPGGSSETDSSGMPSGDMYETALHLSEMMTAYYGLPVRLGDYQLSGSLAYYRTDMYSRGLVIPMYGVARAAGFTMNERV